MGNLQSLLEWLRLVIGTPNFYKQLTSTSNYTWDYGAMIEYIGALLLVLIVVASVFKIVRSWLCPRDL